MNREFPLTNHISTERRPMAFGRFGEISWTTQFQLLYELEGGGWVICHWMEDPRKYLVFAFLVRAKITKARCSGIQNITSESSSVSRRFYFHFLLLLRMCGTPQDGLSQSLLLHCKQEVRWCEDVMCPVKRLQKTNGRGCADEGYFNYSFLTTQYCLARNQLW